MPGPKYTSPSSKRGKMMVKDFAREIYKRGGLSRKATERELRRGLKAHGRFEFRSRP